MKDEKLHREFERLIDYEVQDQSGKKVGTVHSVWTDDLGHRLFLSVKTGWFFGKHHVVPAHTATVNDKKYAIRLPYTEAKIKDAPTFDESIDLSPSDTSRIYSYYGVQEPRLAAEKVPMATAATTQYATAETLTTAREPLVKEGEATMKLSEEELKIGKREVVVGGIRLHKIVRKETVSKPVDLKREKFVIERVAATGKADHEFEDEDVFIPLRREEAVVEKDSHIREEVRIRKEAFTEKETVSGEIRREDVEIDEKAQHARFSKGEKELATAGRYEPKERSR